MKEINIAGYSMNIWNKLDKILNEINNENDSVRITLKFLDGKNINSLKRLNTFYGKLQRDNVNFVLSYCFSLTKDHEKWLAFAKRMREGMLAQARGLDKELIKDIDKIIFNFSVLTANKNNLNTLRDIKNLSPASNERFEVNFLIKKYLYQIEIAVTNNDRGGWINAFNLLKEENVKCKNFKNEINKLVGNDLIVAHRLTLKLQVVLNNNDSTNLRYFLPLWNHYKNEYEISLEVLCREKSLGYRVLQLFSEFKSNVFINVIYERQTLIEPKDFIASDIFPLLELKSETDLDAICFKYIHIYLRWISDLSKYKGDDEKKLDFNVKQRLRDSLFVLIIENSLSEEIDLNKKRLLDAYITENILLKLKDVSKSNNKSLSDLDIGTRAEIERLLGDLNNNIAIEIMYEELSKTCNDNKDLINKFLQKIPNKFEFMIYLVMMRNYIFERNIYRIKTDNELDLNLNFTLIKDTWFNSKTYAEGLLQIIENALRHSQGEVAYFGVRIYNADPCVTMSALTKEAFTRDMLWHKYWDKEYWDESNVKRKLNLKVRKNLDEENIDIINTSNANNIFNLKDESGSIVRFPNFIEFYLLDDALDKNDNALGIVNKIQETLPEINSIEKIFELTEEDYPVSDRLSFYIQHYGMRWLRRHVETLNGLIEIYSPFAFNDASINTTGKNRQESANKERAYSNIFENLGDINIDWANLYYTEYSILIPLEYTRDK